jgi:hypothetical protein
MLEGSQKRWPACTGRVYPPISRALPNTLETHAYSLELLFWKDGGSAYHRNQRKGSGTGRPKLEAGENAICLYERFIPPFSRILPIILETHAISLVSIVWKNGH